MEILEETKIHRCPDGVLWVLQRLFVASKLERWNRCDDRKPNCVL